MGQKTSEIRNYEKGWNCWHSTTLQRKLNSLYENSKENLGDNSELLEDMTKIAGNRGYSHVKRLAKISGSLNPVYNSLNDSEKNYVGDLLDISYGYLRETKKMKNGNIRLKRKIKDLPKVGGGLIELKKNFENNGYKEFSRSLEERTARVDDYTNPEIIRLENHRVKPEKRSHRKLAGSTLIKGLVTLGVLGAVTAAGFMGNYFGKKNQQPVIDKQTKTITTLKESSIDYKSRIFTLSTKYNKAIEKNTELEEKLEIAGRPDNEVRKEALKNQQPVIDKQTKTITELEEKLEIAGRPDNEVRKEALKNMVEGKRYDKLSSQFAELSDKYEVIKDVNKRMQEQVDKLISGKATAEAQGEQLAQESVDEKTVEDKVSDRAFKMFTNEYARNFEDKDFETVTNYSQFEKEVDLNNSDESNEPNACPCAGIVKQLYLEDEFLDYSRELHQRCVEHSKKGEVLEDLITRAGWILAVGNDIIEVPVRGITSAVGGIKGAADRVLGPAIGDPVKGVSKFAFGTLGGVSGTLEGIIFQNGNNFDRGWKEAQGLGEGVAKLIVDKDNNFDKGWKTGDEVGAFLMDGFYGGRTKTEFDGKLLQLDLKGALAIPYCTEDTKLGGDVKLAEVVWWDFVFPWLADDIFSGDGGGPSSGGGRTEGAGGK